MRDLLWELGVQGGVIRSVIHDLVGEQIRGGADQRLVVLGMKINAAFCEILARLLCAMRRFDLAALFPLLIHTAEPIRRPSTARFHESNAQLGKSSEHAAEH